MYKRTTLAFFVGFEFIHAERGGGVWKLNTQLLKELNYVNEIKDTIQSSLNKYAHLKPLTKWEYLKEDIRKATKTYCKGRTSRREVAIGQLAEKDCRDGG